MAIRPRILCVDDERLVTESLAVHLRRYFDVSTAESGEAGLEVVERGPPFAVVLSDMRMPGMNGAEFLAGVRARSPDTARVLLTGHADMDSAMAAINKGRIFRFLVKPCPAPVVLETMQEGAEQYRLVNAEKELLEHTLAGSVKVLTDILSLSSPLAFGRASRIAARLGELCDALEVRERWAIALCAPLYHLGFVTLPDTLVEKVYYGHPLDPAGQAALDGVPAVSEQLLAHVPRLAPVREIIAATSRSFDGKGSPAGAPRGEALPLGARMLRPALALDGLEAAGTPSGEALGRLSRQLGDYDPLVLEALASVAGCRVRLGDVRPLPLAGLRPGMVLAEDVRMKNGTLLLARQLTLTSSALSRLRNLAPGTLKEPLLVHLT